MMFVKLIHHKGEHRVNRTTKCEQVNLHNLTSE